MANELGGRSDAYPSILCGSDVDEGEGSCDKDHKGDKADRVGNLNASNDNPMNHNDDASHQMLLSS